PSPTLQVTTPPSNDTEPPTAPTNVHTTNVTSSSISLAWTAATDNVGVKGYNVYDNGNPTRLGTTTGTSLTIDGLPASKTFNIVVKAFDENQEGPASSPPLPVTTSAGGCTRPVCAANPVAKDNDVVWGLVTLPDGTILYNRRDAHNITRLDPRTGTKTNVG